MRHLLIIACALLGASTAFAKEYGNYDGRRLLTVTETPSGERQGIDMPYLDSMLNDRAALVNGIGHNLNIPGAAEKGRLTQSP